VYNFNRRGHRARRKIFILNLCVLQPFAWYHSLYPTFITVTSTFNKKPTSKPLTFKPRIHRKLSLVALKKKTKVSQDPCSWFIFPFCGNFGDLPRELIEFYDFTMRKYAIFVFEFQLLL
jgi:hypothetical protein